MKISLQKYDKKKRSGRLVVSGEFTIQNAAEIKLKLLNALDKSDSLILDLTQIDECDFTGIQLFYSLLKSAETRKTKITSGGEIPDVLKEVIKDSGFVRLENIAGLIEERQN